jgi:hypothetical protein
LFIGCNKSNPTEPVTINTLAGIWQETFEWIDPTPQGGTSIDSGITKISTLTFCTNTFEVKILPPHRIISLQSPGFIAYSPDTSYSGVFKVSGDTLFLETDTTTEQFIYSLTGDTLRLQTAGKMENYGIISYPLFSFLWGHSWFKHGGIFHRIN